MKIRSYVGICLVLCLLFIAGPGSRNVSAHAVDPSMVLTTLDGSDSTTVGDLYADKPLYINFWASWCPPCVSEMPDIQTMYEKYGDRINFAAVTVDDNTGDAAAYQQNAGLTLPIYTGNVDELVSFYHLDGIPVSVLVDTDGTILARQVGSMSMAGMELFLSPVLQD